MRAPGIQQELNRCIWCPFLSHTQLASSLTTPALHLEPGRRAAGGSGSQNRCVAEMGRTRLLLPPTFLQTTEAATMNQATEHLHREGQMPSWESRAKLLQSYLTLQPHRLKPARLLCPWISQARILAWVVIPFSRGSSRPGDQTRFSGVSCTGRRILNH